SKMFIAHTGYLEFFNLVVKHILPGMGLFFYFVLHFNCKFAPIKKAERKSSFLPACYSIDEG
ncbi:helix-turn-helix domain-containing protein, partial [Limosilactobacillus fermentum]